MPIRRRTFGGKRYTHEGTFTRRSAEKHKRWLKRQGVLVRTTREKRRYRGRKVLGYAVWSWGR